MTELQKKELEILREFIRVCDELNLTYFLVCGSALGAEKYAGFIPWDDDIDVGMPREDYVVFCEKAQELLPPHLFLQNHKTDREYPLIFSKIRNSNTTFIETSLSKRKINHGIYIDVFPLDGYPSKESLICKVELVKKIYALARLSCLEFDQTWKTKIFVSLLKLFQVHKNFYKVVDFVEREISKYSNNESLILCNHGNWQGKLEYAPIDQYGKGKYANFEGVRVRIPVKINEYLTQKYGDWRNDLPDDQKEGHHYHQICDCHRSYVEYM